MENVVEKAKEHFETLVKAQLKRIEVMKKGADWIVKFPSKRKSKSQKLDLINQKMK